MSVERLDKSRVLRVLTLGWIAVFFATVPAAGGVLAVDANAMASWYGTQAFVGSLGGYGLPPFFHANVDYAVYAPGQFAKSFSGQDPSGGGDYVYAYQFFHTGPLTDTTILQLTVGLDGDETVRNIGSFGEGLAPTYQEFQGNGPTSAGWFFSAISPANPDPYTKILIYTSPASPEYDLGTLQGGSTTACKRNLPSPGTAPAPEPSALVLLGGAAAALLLRRVARRSG